MILTVLANAGLMVEATGRGLMVDGFYSDEGHPFGPMPPALLARLMETRADALLYTHLHPDHCDTSRTAAYCSTWPVEYVAYPPAHRASELWECSLALVRTLGAGARPLEPERGRLYLIDEGPLVIEAFCTRHQGPQFADVEHLCYRLSDEHTRLLVSGDADCEPQGFAALAAAGGAEAAVVNPLFLQSGQGPETLKQLGVRRVFINHLPGQDFNGLRKMAARQERRLSNSFEVLALQTVGQSIRL